MKRVKFSIILLIAFVISLNIYSEERRYRWPLSINNGYSASFQEFRDNHFHAGIDLRTFQKTGFPVYAISEGKIFKIRSVRRGGGRGVYIKHSDGYTSIYYHLEKFNSQLERILKRVRRIRGKYIGSYLLKYPVSVKEGTLIGYTGETGSGFPHLHLEIRDQNYFAVNPFKLLKFPANDSNSPIIKELIFRTIGKTKINNKIGEVVIKVDRKRNIKQLKKVLVNGEFEIILNTFDIADTGRHVSPASVRVSLNDNEIFDLDFERFSRDDNNQLGFVYDMFYTTYSNFFFNIFSQTGYKIEHAGVNTESLYKLLKTGENNLSFLVKDNFGNFDKLDLIITKVDRFPVTSNTKFPSDKDSEEYLSTKTDITPILFINRDKVSVIIRDPGINTSNIILQIRPKKTDFKLEPEREERGVFFTFTPSDKEIKYKLDFSIVNKDKLLSMFRKFYTLVVLKRGIARKINYGCFQASFGENAVYEDKVIAFSNEKYPTEFPRLSEQVNIYPYSFPFLDTVFFSFIKKIENPLQAGIFKYSFKKKRWIYQTTYLNKSKNVFKTRQLNGGVFSLLRDIFPPEISLLRSRTQYLSGMNSLVIIIKDKGKGVNYKKIYLKINAKYIDEEYDPDRKWIKVKNPGKYLRRGKNIVNISAEDRGGNSAEKEYSFLLK